MNVVTFAEEILAMSRELDRLRKEVARLKHYEAEYNTLVRDSIRHSEKMMANTMDLVMKPGVSEALQASVGVPEGFTLWAGGECPVESDTNVDVLLRGGTASTCLAGNYSWRLHRDSDKDIIAYRVVETPQPKVPDLEGFTPWAGGECPVAGDVLVEVVFDDGNKGLCSAAYLHRANTNPPNPPKHGNITAYKVVK